MKKELTPSVSSEYFAAISNVMRTGDLEFVIFPKDLEAAIEKDSELNQFVDCINTRVVESLEYLCGKLIAENIHSFDLNSLDNIPSTFYSLS